MRREEWVHPTGAVLACLVTLLGCAEEPPDPPPRPRPISVIELRETDPVESLQLTGSVKSWKEQDVSFEVSGRVAFVVDSTTQIEGRWVEDGTVVVPGGVLARLDPREYLIARDTAQAAVEVAEENVGLARVELLKVLPANVSAAKANRDRAEAEFVRIEQAREKDAVSELDLIRAQADRDQGLAGFVQAEAAIDAKKAEIKSLSASANQAREQLAQAQYDLDRCTLYAPLTGEVSEVFIEAGGYAQAGAPVAHLVMMDPIKVDLAVSAATAARIKWGDTVRVFPAGSETSALAWVHQKSTVADPETRTFLISMMCRNEWRYGGFAPGDPLLDLPRIDRYTRLLPVRAGDPSSAMGVEATRALHQEEATGEWYVWASDEIERGRTLDRTNPVLTLRKVRVVPADERRNYQGLFVLQALEDPGDLTENSLIAHGVPKDFEDGGQVVLARKEWSMRAGQLVPVLLAESEPAPGFYLPMNLIKNIDQETGYLFVEQDGKARKVTVKMLNWAGDLVRIEPAESGQAGLLVPGARVIVEHVHFLQDGEPVRVVETRELSR